MPYLLIDSSGLMYHARFTTGELEANGRNTGIIYGFLGQIYKLKKTFPKHAMVLCYDSRVNLRKELLDCYKANRTKGMTEEELEQKELAFEQFKEIRLNVMPRLGFDNAFLSRGYEADDIIASIVNNTKEECIIASADKDLYQLLHPHVKVYKGKNGFYDSDSFFQEWNVDYTEWANVKALAGCSTDNVPGIVGVAEKTAAKFLSGELKKGKKYDLIMEQKDAMVKINFPLVALPFAGTPTYEIYDDVPFDVSGFLEVCMEYSLNVYADEVWAWKQAFKHGI